MLVLPKELWATVLTQAQDSFVGGHVRVARTKLEYKIATFSPES